MSKPFLYQINFNREKYPEVCAELEAAKDRTGGIAWYLRKLIEKEIEEKESGGVASIAAPAARPIAQEEISKTIETPKPKVKSIEDELPDDSGGFL